MGLVRKRVPTLEHPAPGSLAGALSAVPEPRQPFGWRPGYSPVPLVALLQVAVAAMLCGARGPTAVAQWARERQEDDPALLLELGVPVGRGVSTVTMFRVFAVLDVAAFERALGGWLAGTGVAPDEPLALDGKTLRGSRSSELPGAHLVAAYSHQAGAVLAQVRSAGKGQELAAAKTALTQVPLAGRVVTADALLTQRELCEQVVAAQGAYLLPVKENQPALLADLQAAFSPLGTGADDGGDHGAGAPAASGTGRARGAAELVPPGRAESPARAARAARDLGAHRPRAERLRWQLRNPRDRLAPSGAADSGRAASPDDPPGSGHRS
jgi:hypothetical protein